jgi:hypothetical protein
MVELEPFPFLWELRVGMIERLDKVLFYHHEFVRLHQGLDVHLHHWGLRCLILVSILQGKHVPS